MQTKLGVMIMTIPLTQVFGGDPGVGNSSPTRVFEVRLGKGYLELPQVSKLGKQPSRNCLFTDGAYVVCVTWVNDFAKRAFLLLICIVPCPF